ncbi:hypothetical protein HPB50_012773 [Hyalomma asiaticum]|uniref:Uncharacterized protein n=1 Tax=Hyalomma asiaticum TaxID=266040 RepID=A0ACB7T9I8_HYAAI|nr:hypothetical protein HPB50_012773 [Hyalomma asiaticum]
MNSAVGRADVSGHSKTSRPDVGKIVGPDLVFCKWPGCLPTVGNWSANGLEPTSWFAAVLVRASLGPHARPEHLPTVAGARPLRFWDYSPLNMNMTTQEWLDMKNGTQHLQQCILGNCTGGPHSYCKPNGSNVTCWK